MSDDLDRILALAQTARKLSDGPNWKTDVEAAIEAHGDACEAVWDALYAALDVRAAEGLPVPVVRTPPDKRKELRKLLASSLKNRLPDVIDECIAELAL